ncbi:MAG TPA: XRE family transcriptional regulator [Rubrobacter sp.]|nr:XRE family transcriptional regulator [Rubrobacter sp.]
MESLGRSGGASAGNVEEMLSGVGRRLREARLTRDMTQEEVSAASGVSVAHLSRLESGARQPSVATLLNVAAGLGISISDLLEAPREPGPGTVVRGSEAPFYEGAGFRFQPLMPEAGPAGLAAVKVVFPVDRVEPAEHHRHEGEEWLYVLSGRLRLTLGEESTVLGPGDAAFFDGMLEHSFDVLGDEDVEMLVVAGAEAPVTTGLPSGGAHPLHEGHHVMGERSQPSGEV